MIEGPEVENSGPEPNRGPKYTKFMIMITLVNFAFILMLATSTIMSHVRIGNNKKAVDEKFTNLNKSVMFQGKYLAQVICINYTI